MKTERMVLLVTPAEKREIAAKAARLGVSAGAFVRRAVELFDADDLVAMEELAALVPELNAMADRIERDRVATEERHAEFERELADLRSPAYRTRLRAEIAQDDTINWDAVEALFGRAMPRDEAA